MPLWSIKLSLTISARFVNFFSTPSFKALIARLAFLQFAISALTTNAFPAVVSLLLLCFLLNLLVLHPIFPEPLYGVISITSTQIQIGQELYPYTNSDVSFRAWLIIFKLASGKRMCLWRDSVSENDYRSLLVMLRTQKTPSNHSVL